MPKPWTARTPRNNRPQPGAGGGCDGNDPNRLSILGTQLILSLTAGHENAQQILDRVLGP